MLQLDQLDYIPQDLLTLQDISLLHKILPNPTLLHVKGKNEQPLFVSVLLHANEGTGFFAMQQLLNKYQDHPLPRSLIIFIGNIEASKTEARRLEGQPDYNRVWPGGELTDTEEGKLMDQVVNAVAETKPFASIDIHNNTGKNPHYGCINFLDAQFLHLAALFSRTVVFFETPKGVQSMAMSKYCPSITLECGKPDEPHGIDHARDYVDTILHLESLSTHPVSEHDVSVYHTVARVVIPEAASFDFKTAGALPVSGASHDLCFEENFDKLNFSDLYPGHVFGKTNPESTQLSLIQALDDHERDVTEDFFEVSDNQLLLNKTVMPAMITLDKKIIRQDCLCYLMEPLTIDQE